MLILIPHGSSRQHCGEIRNSTIGSVSTCPGVKTITALFNNPPHFRQIKAMCNRNIGGRTMAAATPYGGPGYGLVFADEIRDFRCFNYPYFDLTEEDMRDAYEKIINKCGNEEKIAAVFYCTSERGRYHELYFKKLGRFLSFKGIENFTVVNNKSAGRDALKYMEALCEAVENGEDMGTLLHTGYISRNPGDRKTYGRKSLIECLHGNGRVDTVEHFTDLEINELFEDLVRNKFSGRYSSILRAWNWYGDKTKQYLLKFADSGMSNIQFNACFEWFGAGDNIGNIVEKDIYSLMVHPREYGGDIDNGIFEYMHLMEPPAFTFGDIFSLANYIDKNTPENASYGWIYDILRKYYRGDWDKDIEEDIQTLEVSKDELCSLADKDNNLDVNLRESIKQIVGSGKSTAGISCEDGNYMLTAVKRAMDYIEKFINKGPATNEPWKPQYLNINHPSIVNPVFLLYGAAGTGKTTKAAAECVEKKHPYEACAFTGRASNTLQSKGLENAKTIHRLLKVDPHNFRKFTRSENTPGLIVIDEFSMVDLFLFYQLLRRLKNKTFLLAGDPYQLPPVKGINIFEKIIRSPHVRKCELTENVRSEGKSIINLSESIRKQSPLNEITDRMVRITREELDSSYFYEDNVLMIEPGESSNEALIETSRDVLEKLKGISRSIIPSTQVICPLKGLANDINSAIRQIFLGNGIEPESIYTTGEKVIQLSNDYKIGGGPVYNGEIGEITSVKHNEYTIKYVRTDNEHAIITYSEGKALRNISYGYCITIHKAQGSEYDNVIAVLPETRMLDLRLLYTAVTRARKKLIIISSEKAIAMAHENGFF